MHPPTGQATERRYSRKLTTQAHKYPHRGETLAKFDPQPTHNIPHLGGSLETFGTQGGSHPEPTSAGMHP